MPTSCKSTQRTGSSSSERVCYSQEQLDLVPPLPPPPPPHPRFVGSLSFILSVCLFLSVTVSVCLSVFVSFSLPVSLSVCLSPSVCRFLSHIISMCFRRETGCLQQEQNNKQNKQTTTTIHLVMCKEKGNCNNEADTLDMFVAPCEPNVFFCFFFFLSLSPLLPPPPPWPPSVSVVLCCVELLSDLGHL